MLALLSTIQKSPETRSKKVKEKSTKKSFQNSIICISPALFPLMTPGAIQRINPTKLPLLRRTAPLYHSKSPLSFLSITSPQSRFFFSLSRAIARSLYKPRCFCSKMATSQVVVREPDLFERKKVSICNAGTGKLQVRMFLSALCLFVIC
jgi:hypothetical protein